MLSSKIPRKQPDPTFQVYEDEDDSEVAAFLSGHEPLAFSFTGIPLSRPKPQSNRPPGPSRPPPPEKAPARLARARHGSVGSLSIEEPSSPRVDGSGDGGRRSRSRTAVRPMRSSSCARLAPRKDPEGGGSGGGGGGDPDRLAGLPLRQTLPLLRRSLTDLTAALGVDPHRARGAAHGGLEEENRRLEADWTLFCRQLSEEPRRTAVVPPFTIVPPPVAAEEPPRPATPSRIPVPRSASPARPSPRRAMSVCQDGPDKAAPGRDKAPMERRASCDFFKISTPLVTGRSSIVGARAATPSRAISGGHRSRRGREA